MTLLLVCVALVLVACGGEGGGDVAATVDDSEVTVEDVRSFPFDSSGTIGTQEFAQYLGALIQWRILDDAAAEEFGIDPTPEEVDEELTVVLTEQMGGASIEDLAEQQNLSEETVRSIVRVGLIQELVAAELSNDLAEPTDDQIATAMETQRAGLTEVCARHILVATAEEAEEAADRIEGGEEFEAVAAAMSTDPSAAENGGDLGCAPAETYVPAFRAAAVSAEIDEMTEPVQTQFGFHLIVVYDRTDPAEEDLPAEDDIRQTLLDEAGFVALEEWLVGQVNEAEVTVDEEYGTWTLEPQPGVQPPAS